METVSQTNEKRKEPFIEDKIYVIVAFYRSFWLLDRFQQRKPFGRGIFRFGCVTQAANGFSVGFGEGKRTWCRIFINNIELMKSVARYSYCHLNSHFWELPIETKNWRKKINSKWSIIEDVFKIFSVAEERAKGSTRYFINDTNDSIRQQ